MKFSYGRKRNTAIREWMDNAFIIMVEMRDRLD